MAPAVKNYRKYLVADIHHSRIIEDEEALAKLYEVYDILSPYIQLFKEFPKFLKRNMKICAVSDSIHNTILPVC